MFWSLPVRSESFLFFIVMPHFPLFSLMLRYRKDIAATASMHITLQVPIEDSVMAAIR